MDISKRFIKYLQFIPNRMPRNIIVEGVECGGKTTLIDEMRRQMKGWDIKFLGHKDGDQFRRYAWEYQVNKGTIFNRAHYSEIVYSKLWDRNEPFTSAQRQCLDDLVAEDNIIILASPTKEIMLKRYKQRGYAQMAKLEELGKIHDIFGEVMQNVPCLVYGSENMGAMYAMVEQVKRIVEGGK